MGIKIAMGTDSGTPCNEHDKCYKEVELYVENGMTPMEAILTATKTASELLEIDKEYGTLEPGKYADYLVLAENPLQDITTLSRIVTVYKHGEAVNL